MKFLVFLGLLALAMGSEEECTEERAEACIDDLLTTIIAADATEEAMCEAMRTTVNCLEDTVDDCLGDEPDEDVEKGLQEMRKVLRENCDGGSALEGDDDDDMPKEMQNCFEDNQEYIFGCIEEATTGAISLATDHGETDENYLQCMLYGMMTNCYLGRISEKCGQEAADMFERQEMESVPKEMLDACEAAGNPLAHEFGGNSVADDFDLLGERKKK